MIKEEVLRSLQELGFMPEQISDAAYCIDYEESKIYYTVEDEDVKSVSFASTKIFDITDENRQAVYSALLQLNNQVKFVQANAPSRKCVWLSYHHFLGDNVVTTEVIRHMIQALSYAVKQFKIIMNNSYED